MLLVEECCARKKAGKGRRISASHGPCALDGRAGTCAPGAIRPIHSIYHLSFCILHFPRPLLTMPCSINWKLDI